MPMNTHMLWDHALDHLNATAPDPQTQLAQWRTETPHACSDADLLREYAWVVGSCGLTPQVMQKRWEQLGEAFFGWDPARVTARERDARLGAHSLLRNPRKIAAILGMAADLAREPGLMARLTALPVKEVLAQLQTQPYVGSTNRYHLARNLGWDVVVKTGPVQRLAAYLLVTPEELCTRIAEEQGERVRTVDLVLWYWGHKVGDGAMKETASYLFTGPVHRFMPPDML